MRCLSGVVQIIESNVRHEGKKSMLTMSRNTISMERNVWSLVERVDLELGIIYFIYKIIFCRTFLLFFVLEGKGP